MKIINRQRRYAPFFEWPDKKVKEKGVVKSLCESMEKNGETPYKNIVSMEGDPPDCTAIDANGNRVGIEVTEFVCEEAVKVNQKGKSMYRDWTPGETVTSVKNILVEKNNKKYNGGPYSEIVLIIYTDESTITWKYKKYASILARKIFDKPSQIGTAFFLFSYNPDPSPGYYPYVRLNFSGSKQK